MNFGILGGMIKPFMPAIVKSLPGFESKAVEFFNAQPVPEGITTDIEGNVSCRYRFAITLVQDAGNLYAVPSILDAETNVVMQTKVNLNGTEYEAVKLTDLLTEILNKQ